MGTPPDVAAAGLGYLGLYVLAAPVLYGYFVVDATFRAAGDTRTPFLILAGAVAVSLLLDPMLILGLGPMPRLGIAGAALATVTTRSLAFVVGLVLLRRRGMLRLGRPRLPVLARIARVGAPTAATGVFFSVVYVVVARTASRFGTPALAALGLGFRVESWLYMIGVGFGAAAAAVVGQNLGAGRVDRAERAGWTMLGVASTPAAAGAAIAFLLPEWVAGVFTHDLTVIAETARYLRIAALAQLVVCAEVVLEGALGGAGETVAPMLASTSLTGARIPLAQWAGARFGTVGLWWVISLTAVGRGLAMMALWRGGRWKRKSV
jgi:putative MATE family efflux protein